MQNNFSFKTVHYFQATSFWLGSSNLILHPWWVKNIYYPREFLKDILLLYHLGTISTFSLEMMQLLFQVRTYPKNLYVWIFLSLKSKIKYKAPESPGSPVVRTLCFFHGGGPGSFPGQGTEILQAMWCGQKKRERKRMQVMQFVLEMPESAKTNEQNNKKNSKENKRHHIWKLLHRCCCYETDLYPISVAGIWYSHV